MASNDQNEGRGNNVFRVRFIVAWPIWAGGYPDQQESLRVLNQHRATVSNHLETQVRSILGQEFRLADFHYDIGTYAPIGGDRPKTPTPNSVELYVAVNAPSSASSALRGYANLSRAVSDLTEDIRGLIQTLFITYMPGVSQGANIYIVDPEQLDNRTRSHSWSEEVEILHKRLRSLYLGLDVRRTELVSGWENEPWLRLERERDRLQIIKTHLGWLSIDAVARVDSCLSSAGEIIDAGENFDSRIAGRSTEAALRLSMAERMLQQAWKSRYWNSWPTIRSWPTPFPAPMWLALSLLLLPALGLTIYVIFSQGYFPKGLEVGIPEALFAAAFWGLGGGLVTAFWTLHLRVQGQLFEIERVAWYVLSPVIGFAFGAITFLLFMAGLLSTGQEFTGSVDSQVGFVDPTPILVLAVLAGLGQNAFMIALQRIIGARFSGP
jgi:hypothetical protein